VPPTDDEVTCRLSDARFVEGAEHRLARACPVGVRFLARLVGQKDHDCHHPLSPFLLCGRPFFFFNVTATPEIYTLSLHDALPIFKPVQDAFDRPLIASGCFSAYRVAAVREAGGWSNRTMAEDMDLTWSLYRAGHKVRFVSSAVDRKSTRLNSSH